MLKKAADSFIGSYKEHPELTMFVMLMCSCIMGYSVYTFAEKVTLQSHIADSEEQFKAQERHIQNVEHILKSALKNQEIRDIEKEIFDLQRFIDRGDAREIDYIRLNTLKSDLGEALRALTP